MYAHVINGVVVETFTPPAGVPISDCFVPTIAAAFVPVPNGVNAAPHWTYDGTTWAAPQIVTATPAQSAAQLMAAGLTITSTATPALNGTYDVDDAAQSNIVSEMLCIQVSGKFADGGTTLAWPDKAGTIHTFPSTADFTAFALAAAAFVANCSKVASGASTLLPLNTATIP